MAANPHAEHLEELLEGLNEPQREAVTHGEGPLLILAGAGSGKTRVLTHRIAFLIYTDQAQAGEILAITFTNKAASEMRGRVERLLGRGTRGMWLMTFHAACARILRAEADAARLHAPVHDLRPGRRAPADQALADAVGVDPKRFTPAAIHNQISAAKNRLRDAAEYRESVGVSVRGDGRRRLRALRARSAAHERDGLRRPAVPDRQPARAVRGGPRALRRRPSATCSSTSTRTPTTRSTGCCSCSSAAGASLGEQRASAAIAPRTPVPIGHRNLAVVGDDAQSIYGFRGADVRNILDFQEDFPDARVVKLEQNYRSTQTILSAANAVIANNRGGIAKRLWSELGRGRPDPPARARRRARRGALRRRRDRAAPRRGRRALGDRGALPHERDVAGDRGHARAARDRLPGDRRHEVLRARRDQGRDRLPVAAGEPLRRGQLHARRQLAAARDRADLARARVSRMPRRSTSSVWQCRELAERSPASARPR